MALRLVRKPAVALSAAPAVAVKKPPVQAPARVEKPAGEAKTVTVRVPSAHMAMLEEIQSVGECPNRTEAVLRAIRFLHQAYSSETAVLTITDASGVTHTQRIVTGGVPC